jgi:hypothetical protein
VSIVSATIVPVLFIVLQAVEYVALIKSLWRLAVGKKTKWTVWQRQGAETVAGK